MTDRDYAALDLPDDGGYQPRPLGDAGSAAVSDALGLAGLDGFVKGVVPFGGERIAGRAVTLGFAPAAAGARASDAPILAIDVIARCRPGDVVVMATGEAPAAFWGEHMVGQALAAQLGGALVDAGVRDVRRIEESGFPVFAAGTCPRTYLGRYEAVAYNEPVTVGGLEIAPGDLVLGDADGVVVVPVDLLDQAEAGVRRVAEIEQKAAQELADGGDPRAIEHEVGLSFVSLAESH
ncbi:MAG TPA: RraA family protein [Solirubrobacterales bacterium]|nr:RraA family protein [Solirubrobacterales bacterium]